MATPYRRNDRGGASDTHPARATPTRAPAVRITGFGETAVKLVIGSLGLAFGAGGSIGIYQRLTVTGGDTIEIANFASRAIAGAFNAPAEWAIDLFVFSNQAAAILLDGIYYLAFPYQELAYAGGYCGSTMVQILEILIQSWSFRF